VLLSYQGGYAAYTKVGGTPPIAPPEIIGLGGNTKIAQRFIPVGQAFFVFGSASGGTIAFNNSQRIFVKENDPNSFELFRSTNSILAANSNATTNSNDHYGLSEFAKIRLGFYSANNLHRQLLFGFMDDNASDYYDAGYDGILLDIQPNDMYFKNQGNNLIIQGVGSFVPNKRYALTVKTNQAGFIKIKLDGVENFDANRKIFIFDAETRLFHNIKNQPFSVKLNAGTYENRFYLTFLSNNNSLAVSNQKTSNSLETNTPESIDVTFENTNQILQITNTSINTIVHKVYLYNLVGQLVTVWDVKNDNQSNIQIPITANSTGVYFVKVETTDGNMSKKISIK
jgi:hypothetical protein